MRELTKYPNLLSSTSIETERYNTNKSKKKSNDSYDKQDDSRSSLKWLSSDSFGQKNSRKNSKKESSNPCRVCKVVKLAPFLREIFSILKRVVKKRALTV